MGFYLRKSISVGPLRFNLSRGGVGVSVGIKGLRIGTGPRGNYVHMGRGGLYYRATLPLRSSARQSGASHDSKIAPSVPPNTHAPLQEIDSTSATRIVDSSSRALLEEMNSKQRKGRLWPWIGASTLAAVAICLIYDWPRWELIVAFIAGASLTAVAALHDALSKTVVLFYEFDEAMERAYGDLHNAAAGMASAAAAWHIEAQGAVYDRKYHAGAGSVVRRKSTKIARAAPPYVKTNIDTILIGVGSQTLHFFPDRVLIYDAAGVGAVGYKELSVTTEPTRFIEDGTPPRDAIVVGRTWRFVNKTGGPDRRFNNNSELPICLYDELCFSSSTGLNEVVQVSRKGAGEQFADAIRSLARIFPKELASQPARQPE